MRFVLRRICRCIPAFALLVPFCAPAYSQSSNVLTIGDAVKDALANNRLLNAGALDIDQASNAAATARTAFLPVLGVNATGGELLKPLNFSIPTGKLGPVNGSPFPVNNSKIYSASGGLALIGISLTQPLTLLPGINLNSRIKRLDIQISTETQRGRRIELAALVKKTYYDILVAQDSLNGARQTLKSDQELERTVSDFVAQKNALQADLLDTQAQTAQAQLKIVQLEDQLSDTKERLNDLLGRDLETPFEVVIPDDTSVSIDDIAALHSFALAHRSDIRQVQLRVAQAALARRLASQPNVPVVSAVVSYNRLAGGPDITGFPNQLSVIGLQLDWKPLDWGKRDNDARTQDDQYKQAQAALLEAQANSAIEVDSAVRKYKEAIATRSVAQLAQQAAAERLREMTNQYSVKAILLKDLLQQQAAAANAADNESLATIQMLATRTGLEVALGDDE